jgi:glycosyltransferase involved in cell wall biosynthesis
MDSASLIIPTYKRVFYIDRIIRSLLSQDISKLKEVIIVDSDSNDGTKDLIKAYENNKQLTIIYENVVNSVARKRNRGIEIATSECLIFIDDDCVPLDGFINSHLDNCKKTGMHINCGNIYFYECFVKESNYIRYRNSRHIPYISIDGVDKKLDYKTIVTMNMSIRKKDIIDNKLFFNEEFIGYGMEDNEFGYRAHKIGFNIVSNSLGIVHLENSNAIDYSKKIYHTARDGVKRFKSISPVAVEGLAYSFYFEDDYPHKNVLMRLALKVFRLFFSTYVANILLHLSLLTDKIKIPYIRVLFRYAYASYYLMGVKDRDKAYQSLSNVKVSWYGKK